MIRKPIFQWMSVFFASIVVLVLTGCGGSSAPAIPTTGGAVPPGAPSIWWTTAGNASATVYFTPPISNGGSAITGYQVTSTPGNITATGSATASAITVNGLTNGVSYTFVVQAFNVVGAGYASTSSAAVIPSAPLTVPGAPTIGAAAAGNGAATVSFTPPTNTGGSAITGYTVTSTPGGLIGTGTASPITVAGLANGTSYTFTVKATNAIGTSAASAATNAVVPTGAPGVPTNVSAVAGTGAATISFTAPNNGGSTITGYTVTSSGGQVVTGTASPITVTGLTNLTSYFFTVTATNALGTSLNSAPSNNVIPTTYFGPFYVNAATGLDTNNGALATPAKTITRALTLAGGVGTACIAPCTVNVTAGTYSVGETFPIKMPNNVTLAGAGLATTFITGNALYTPAGTTISHYTTLVFPPAVTATVSGVTICCSWDAQAIVDGATNATLTSNNINGAGAWADGLWILGASTATLTGNTISGGWMWYGGLYITGTSNVTARSNTISDTGNPAINVAGGGTAATSPIVNLGTTASQGLNIITGPGLIGGVSGSVGLNIVNDANWVNASGNTWHAAVQGSGATGLYGAGTVGTNPQTLVIGNNYAIGTSAGLQF